jgi:RNA polymerase sigma factor (sigma-70 family)
MGTSTDNELVEASRRGELGAFGELVARYQDVVCAVSYSSTGDRALSEDVAQETFVAAWRKLDRVRAGALRPWLCAIARNLGRKARRRTRHEQPIDGDTHVAAGASPFDEIARADSERIVRDALARVPEKYREVLVLYYRDNQSIRDVAETLGISEDAVTQRLSRGRRYLAEGLTALVEKSLRGTRPRRDLVAAVLASVAALVLPSRVDAHPLKAKGSTMLKVAIVASALAAAGTTAYLVRSHDDPKTTVAAAPAAAHPTAAPLHYGTGAARRPALGPTAPVRPSAVRATSVDDLALLPADAELVLGVDVARVQRSALWQMIVAPALVRAPGLHEFQDECGFDPIASLASVTIGLKGTHGDMSGAIVVHGFAKAKALACIEKEGAKHADNRKTFRIDGDVLLVSRDNVAHAALTFLDDTTALLVIGPDASKDAITQVAARRGTAPASSYSDMIREINTDDAVWLAVADGSPMLAEVNRKLASHTAIQLHGLYGSVDFADGLVINAGARTGSPELVAKLVGDVQRKLDEVGAEKLTQRFDQLDINADGGDVIVSVAMNTSQLLSLAGGATNHIDEHIAEHHRMVQSVAP